MIKFRQISDGPFRIDWLIVQLLHRFKQAQPLKKLQFSDLGLGLIDLLGLFGSFGRLEALDLGLELEVLADPLLLLHDELPDPFLELVEQPLLLALLFLALVKLLYDLHVLLAVFALFELLKAVVQGQLLLLASLLLVKQVLELIEVRAFLFLLVLYARRIVHL